MYAISIRHDVEVTQLLQMPPKESAASRRPKNDLDLEPCN